LRAPRGSPSSSIENLELKELVANSNLIKVNQLDPNNTRRPPLETVDEIKRRPIPQSRVKSPKEAANPTRVSEKSNRRINTKDLGLLAKL
jgi:hypothetical protein